MANVCVCACVCVCVCVQDMRDSVVESTLDVYKKVMSSLLPTPTKSHYTFNLRDISRVMQVRFSQKDTTTLFSYPSVFLPVWCVCACVCVCERARARLCVRVWHSRVDISKGHADMRHTSRFIYNQWTAYVRIARCPLHGADCQA